MKTRIAHLIIGLLMISSLKGQIKIGDNPQTLDPSSVLELESTSRVLVITRVTDAQMNTIAPLRGALVYNIDQGCIHYYDGTDWINICEALDNSFTVSTEAVFNQFSRDSTVVVTQTDDNYNFEVNLITGDNIVPTSINGDVHIQPSSITGGLLQDGTIPFDKLADGENTGEVLQWNGNEWILVDETGLVVTEIDGEIGNEVLDATAGGSLVRSGAGTDVDPFTLDVRDGGIGNAELDTDAVTSDKIQNESIITDDIANLAVTNIKLGTNAITSDKVQDGQITRADIADDAINTAKIGTAGAAEGNRILGTDAAGDPQWQDASDLATSLGEDVTSTNNSILGTQANAALVAMDLEVNVDGTTIEVDATNGVQIADDGVTNAKMADNAVNTTEIVDDAVTTVKILDANVTDAKLANDAVTNAKIADNAVTTAEIGTAGAGDANRVLTTDGAGDPQWEDRANFASSALNNAQIFVGDATNTTTGVAMSGDATIDNAGAVTIANDAVTTVKILDANVTDAKLANDAVTNAKIADNAVTTAEIGTAGAGDANRVLTTDGAGDPQWEDRANFASSALNNAQIFVGDATNTATGVAMSGDATIDNAGAVTIANDAVTTVKILDANVTDAKLANDAVTNAKIADNAVTTAEIGTAGAGDANRVLTTDGAGDPQWEDRANFASSALNNAQIFVGDATNTATGVAMSGDATIDNAGAVTIANDAVTTVKILDANVTDAKLANDAVTNAKIADNAVTTAEIGTAGAGDANRVLTTDGAGDPQWEDRANFASSALNNAQIFVGDATNTATGVAMSGDATIDNAGAVTIANDAVTTVKILDANVTDAKLANDAVTNAKIADNAVTTAEIGTAGAGDANRVLTTDGAGDPQWEDRANFASSALNNAQIFVGDATNTATGVAMSGDATIDNAGAVTIANDAVTTVKILDANVTDAKLANDAVTNAKIADNAVTTAEIGTAGAGDANRVLTTDGAGDPQWEDRANFASSALNNAQIFVGDATNTATGVAMSGDATIDNAGAVTIANDAVTTVKILDANVTPVKIQQGTSNQILKTNNAGTAAEWANPITLYHAIGKANGSILTNTNGVASITPLGTGNYQINFSSNASSGNYVIQLTLLNAGVNATIEVVTQANNNFTVQISDSTGTAIDAEWYFTVTDF
ncbi:beta strand repeat-containing protein [Flagellimonas sp.]|uniref:beta strand repeat-containing protein n=1 Tax=Flagellimonas sp. TaxID=2058762 RepID=UPI003B503BAC